MATSILSTKALVDSCEEVEARGARAASNPRPGRTYECEDLCRRGFMLAFSTMGITVIMVGYLMLGAVMFSGLEGGGVGHPSSRAAHGRQGSPTVMNSTMLLGALPTEVTDYIDRYHTVLFLLLYFFIFLLFLFIIFLFLVLPPPPCCPGSGRRA